MDANHNSDECGNSSFWRDRRVFVTGGTGLVGGWLIRRLLDAGADVVCLIRDWTPFAEIVQNDLIKHVTVVRGDICDQECLERILGEHEIETVMHLAAQTIVGIANRNPVSTFEANIGGTWKLLEACRRSPLVKQIVMASSDKAYGDAEVLPYTEETALAGMHPYDVSKSCGDLIAQTYANTYGSPVCVTRCGNFYGGGDLNWNRIIPGTIRSVYRGEAPVIRSDGSFVRDYFYVEDGAAAYMHLAEQMAARPELAGEAFNLSTEIQVSVLEVVNCVLSAMGSSLRPVVLGQASNEIKHQYLDATKAREMLGWQPLFSFEQGLQRTIQWYSNFLNQNATKRPVRENMSVAAAGKAA
ncbi:GDP-mannose 4,6-dehydratase [Rhodopirellula sallentina]|uniref:CDP-glucose 4,6-dehydratase n=1 Tax=Rhodopirellula sallentina SM41 TaxID=1263870 RepID=M5UD59_9BACT|nr:GDP-mannose 4,6-dehydratase [Rhodopirellula sallentina]EMI55786.1 CDP-glucose 4,6-dehydratase [Rhodopirellula sallentina SM41]